MIDSKIVKGSKVVYKDDPNYTPILEVQRFYYDDEGLCWTTCLDEDGGEWEFMLEDLAQVNISSIAHPGDIVAQPNHYSRWEIEPATYIMRNGFEFWRGNIIKYVSRAGFKSYEGKTKAESEIIDLEKTIRYAQMRINQLKGEEIL